MTHRRLDLSRFRRVLAVSDVHGEYPKLAEALERMGWDPDRDALVINGDLCDRGVDSMAAFDWISRPNVHRSLGNHDEIPEAWLEDRCDDEDLREWGAEWLLALDRAEQRRVAVLLCAAPHALTVRTPLGREVGFVHADCGDDWNELTAALEGPPSFARSQAARRALNGRSTIQDLLAAMGPKDGSPPRPYSCRMTGVDHVFHGHTTIGRAFAHHDRTWMDTGACFGRGITVLDVDRWLDQIDLHSPFA